MKYYSEITKKLYDDEPALREAERIHNEEKLNKSADEDRLISKLHDFQSMLEDFNARVDKEATSLCNDVKEFEKKYKERPVKYFKEFTKFNHELNNTEKGDEELIEKEEENVEERGVAVNDIIDFINWLL